MKIYRKTEDDVVQVGDDEFDLQDQYVITIIGKIQFTYSMAGYGWKVVILQQPIDMRNYSEISINEIDEPEYQEMIKQIFKEWS